MHATLYVHRFLCSVSHHAQIAHGDFFALEYLRDILDALWAFYDKHPTFQIAGVLIRGLEDIFLTSTDTQFVRSAKKFLHADSDFLLTERTPLSETVGDERSISTPPAGAGTLSPLPKPEFPPTTVFVRPSPPRMPQPLPAPVGAAPKTFRAAKEDGSMKKGVALRLFDGVHNGRAGTFLRWSGTSLSLCTPLTS